MWKVVVKARMRLRRDGHKEGRYLATLETPRSSQKEFTIESKFVKT